MHFTRGWCWVYTGSSSWQECWCIPQPGQKAAQGDGPAAFYPVPDVTLFTSTALKTGDPFSHSPRECQAHPEGKNPEEVIQGMGGVITHNLIRGREAVFQRSCLKHAHHFYERGSEEHAQCFLSNLLHESTQAGPGLGG